MYNVFVRNTNVSRRWTLLKTDNHKKAEYLLVNSSVLPTIFIKIVKVKKLLATGEVRTVNDAVKAFGVSRSVYYKYKDFVFPFLERQQGSVVTFSVLLEDKPGILFLILSILAESNVNVLTINQNIPIDGVAPVSLTIQTNEASESLEIIFNKMQEIDCVKRLDVFAGS